MVGVGGAALTVATTAVRGLDVHPLLVTAAKYVVVDAMLGVVKLVPVPNEAPPVEAAYQLIVPAAVVACRVTVPVPQIEAPVVLVNVGVVLTVMVTVLLVEAAHPVFVTLAR